jgi:hypothetical protein
VRVGRGGDERAGYPHHGVRFQPGLLGDMEAVLQQPDGLVPPAAARSHIGEPVHGQRLS